MTSQRLASSVGAAEAASEPRENSFGSDGFAGPVRIFSAEQCHLIAARLHSKLPAPADWTKGQAVADRFVYELAARPALLSLLKPLIGDDIILWGARLIERKPGQSHAWHTDIESSALEGGFATVWIGVENTSRESGLQLITRSHRFGKSIQQVYQEKGLRRGEVSAENVLAWAKEIDAEAQFVQPDVTDGEALLVDGRLWHGSHNSRRRGTRLALLLQYAAADMPVRIAERFEWPFQFLEEPRPPVIQVCGTSREGVNRIVPPPPDNPRQAALLTSGVYPLPLPLTEDRERRWRPYRILRGTTPAVGAMGCHMSILSAGHTPHPPHPHPEEEVLIAMEGEVELMISDSRYQGGSRRERIRPGAFVYYPPYLRHTIINPGTSPVTYLMLKWRGEAWRAPEPLPTRVIQYGDLRPPIGKPRWGQRVLRGETPYLGTLSSHVTVLEPGAGYEPHVDPYDVAIVLLSGTVETLGQTVAVPALIYCAAGEPHGMRNIGDAPARYLVFEFHPADVRASLWRSLTRRLSVRATAEKARTRLKRARSLRRLNKTGRRLTSRATKRAARIRTLLEKKATRAIGRAFSRRRFVQAKKQLARSSKHRLRYFSSPSTVAKSGRRLLKRTINSARKAVEHRGVAGASVRAARRLARFVLRAPSHQHERKRAERKAQRRAKKERQQAKHEGQLAKARRQDAKKDAQRLKQQRQQVKAAVYRAIKRRRAGDLAEALAIHDAIPVEFRDARILEERGLILRRLGELNAAHDVFREALALDPRRKTSWLSLGTLLPDLDRSDDLPEFINEMLGALPGASRTLMGAASIARRGRHHRLADDLFDRALSPQLKPGMDTILKAARSLIRGGEQGRAIYLLEKESLRGDADLDGQALDLRGLALSQLRVASSPRAPVSVDGTARADVMAVNSIFDQYEGTLGRGGAARGGIAIVLGTLGPAGVERQTVQLVRQLCRMPGGPFGPISLLLVSRSKLEPQFHESDLAGLNVTLEWIAHFAADGREPLPPGVAGHLSVLPRRIGGQVVFLIDRLKVHKPEVVLAMGDSIAVAAILAASIAGVPRVVVSVRGEPPPSRGLRDTLLKQAYQASLARNRISMVAISATTARQYAEWLDEPPGRINAIYNGIDVDELRLGRNLAATAAHRRSLGVPDDARVVGSIFNSRWEKRRKLWIEAAAIVAKRAPDVVFVLVGGGHTGHDARATLRQHGLEGRFHLPGVRKDVAAWLDLMNVFLLTSKSDAAPNVLMEAQALGRPVVATDVGGVAETFLPEQTGILLSPNPTAEEVADAVMRALDDPGFAERAAVQAPAFIRRRFGVKRMASEYLDLCFGPAPTHGELRSVNMES